MNPFLANHPILQAIQDHILRNFPEYMIFISALAIATVVTMPPIIPKSLQDWWTWMRNSLQTAVPAARNAHVNVSTPQANVAVNGSSVTTETPNEKISTDPTQPAEPAKEG